MELIKRHYEKIILLALSIISIFAVWRMTSIMEKTKEVKDSDLEIRIPPPDQVSLIQKEKNRAELEKQHAAALAGRDAEAAQRIAEELKQLDEDEDFKRYRATGKFDADTIIAARKLVWTKAERRNPNYSSDLLRVFNMARCPECECGIPIYCFRISNKCPICGVHLDPPPARIRKRRRRTPEDLDGDGIPNDVEKSRGMDERYAGDALLDPDGDGFSSRYEILVSNTDPQSPTSHPPLWRRLRFKGMSKVKLDISITSVSPGKSADPKMWTVSIETKERDVRTGRLRTREQECRIGGKLMFEGRTYTVTNIEPLSEKDERGVERKSYAVTLKSTATGTGGASSLDELRLVFGQPTYSNDLRVVLEDIGVPADPDGKRYYVTRGNKTEAVYILRRGGMFDIGGTSDRGPARNVVREFYRLDDFDERARTARLSWRVRVGEFSAKDADGSDIIVTKDSGIEEDDWVTIPTDRPTTPASTGGTPSRRRRE